MSRAEPAIVLVLALGAGAGFAAGNVPPGALGELPPTVAQPPRTQASAPNRPPMSVGGGIHTEDKVARKALKFDLKAGGAQPPGR
jgi:hypothetical protein